MTWKYTSRQTVIGVKKVTRTTELDGEFAGWETRHGEQKWNRWRQTPEKSWKFRRRAAHQWREVAAN